MNAYFITDSIGHNLDGTVVPVPDPRLYPFILADIMGWTPTLDSVGGTGYTLTTGQTFQNRAAACINAAPDVIFIEGGTNDVSIAAVSVQTLQAAVSTLLATLRASLPDAVIFVLGVYVPGSPNASWLSYNVAVRAAVELANGWRNYFLDNLTTPWVTDANKAVNIASDNLHLSSVGHAYFAGKAAVSITRLNLT